MLADRGPYDGVWVLRTNTALSPMVTALAYKHLWVVEAIFRSMKSLLDTRPAYHTFDATIRGHVFCSFQVPAFDVTQLVGERPQANQRKLGGRHVQPDMRVAVPSTRDSARGVRRRPGVQGLATRHFGRRGRAGAAPVRRPARVRPERFAR